MMPSNVRMFWWFSVTIVVYWVLTTAWYLAFPSAHELAALAKLPLEFGERIRRFDFWTRTISTSFWCAVTLGLAWLAAFRHANWARWGFAALFIFRESIMFLVSVIYYHNLDFFRASLAHENWTNPRGYIMPAVTIAAIGFVFSGNARSWFRADPSTTQDQTALPIS